MKPHALRVAGNVVTSLDDGSLWAVWQVEPVPYAVATLDQRLAHKAAVERVLRGLRRPALLFSVCQPVTPERVAELMMGGASGEVWEDRVDRTVTELIVNGRSLHDRTFWFAAQVTAARSTRADTVRTAFTNALSVFFQSPRLVDVDEDAAVAELVERAETGLGLTIPEPGAAPVGVAGRVVARRATVADVEWLTVRLAGRGTPAEVPLTGWGPAAARVGPADPGGPDPRMRLLNTGGWSENWLPADAPPLKGARRHVAAEAGDGQHISYQTSLVLADGPADIHFPGGLSEWLRRASQAQAPGQGSFPVDWFVWVNPWDPAKAVKKVRARHTNMAGQVEEQYDDLTGTPGGVVDARDVLGDLADELEQNVEPLLRCVTWFTVTAGDVATLERRAASFQMMYPSSRFQLTRPGLDQMTLTRASQPGAPLPSDLQGDYRRFLTVGALAAGGPYCAAQVGDPCGALFAANMADGHAGPLFIDPASWSRDPLNRASSMMFVGSTGFGKSQSVKTLIDLMNARGSQVAIVDLDGEYTPVVKACGGQIVDPFRAAVSFDPLALLYSILDSGVLDDGDAEAATERAKNAVVGLVDELVGGIEPNGAVWAALRAAVDRAVTGRRRLMTVVNACTRSEVLRPLSAPLKRVAEMPRMRALFDPALPALDLAAGVTGISVPGLALPGRDRKATSEELQGVMVLYGIVHAVKEAIYKNKDRHGVVVLDEAWALFRSRYASEMIDEFARAGRRHWAGVVIVTQHAWDVPEQIVAQIDVRFVFGLLDTKRDDGSVGNREAGLGLLGPAGKDPDVVVAFSDPAWPAGRCLMRDVRGRVGVAQWLTPLTEAMREAVDTSARDRRVAAAFSEAQAAVAG